MRRLLVLVALAASLLLLVGAKGAPERRALMAELFEGLRVALPLSASADTRRDPALERALERLASQASALEQHERLGAPDEQVLSRGLAGDAGALLHSWRRGRHEEVAYRLQALTQSCVACHARLPSDSSPLAQGFLAQGLLDGMPPKERAPLLVATRRFDEALSTWEQLFADPSVHPSRMLAALDGYLTTSVRVQGDLARPLAPLAALAARDDAWGGLQQDVAAWRKALERYGRSPPAATLAGARAVFDEARRMSRYPADRRALVHWIVGSRALHGALAAGPRSPNAAEAYYLLALAEARIGDGDWLPRAQAWLEACVRRAPHSEVAERCHGLLEEQMVIAYVGSEGQPLPEELERALSSLQELARRER